MPVTKRVFVIGSFVVAASAKVPRLPISGESLSAEAFILEPGGKGFNLAVGLARLQIEVSGILAVGDDLFGHIAETILDQAGLPRSMLRRYPGSTGSGVGFFVEGGDNCLAVFSGANLALSAEDVVGAAELAEAAFVLAQFETGDAPIRAAFADARRRGATTVLNPSPYRPIDSAILADTTILVMNETEALSCAEDLFGGWVSEEALAVSLLDQGPDLVVLTLGATGAVAFVRDAPPLRAAAFAVEPLDSLGAGDAFTAGLVAGLIRTGDLAISLRQANACGALCVEQAGVLNALPTIAALERFLEARD